MDTVLIAVTALSLAMAAGMACRCEAGARGARALGGARGGARRDVGRSRHAIRAVPRCPIVAAPAVSPLQRSEQAVRFEMMTILTSGSRRPRSAGVEPVCRNQSAVPWGRRFAVIASLAVVVLVIGLVAVSGKARPTASSAAASSVAQQAPSLGDGPARVVVAAVCPDENAQRLVISGLVQNPRSGAALSRVVATAFLFGPDGTFLTSSRAPLDFTTLAPGVESPFVVSVPVTGQVARYRVGFRTEDGQVIAHVDKRGPEALAQKSRVSDRPSPQQTKGSDDDTHQAPRIGDRCRCRIVDGRDTRRPRARHRRTQGQQPPASDERQSFRFRTGVELINVTATVTDAERPVRLRSPQGRLPRVPGRRAADR